MKNYQKLAEIVLIGAGALGLSGCTGTEPVTESVTERVVSERTIGGNDFKVTEDLETSNPDDFRLYVKTKDGKEYEFGQIPGNYLGQNFNVAKIGNMSIYLDGQGIPYIVNLVK